MVVPQGATALAVQYARPMSTTAVDNSGALVTTADDLLVFVDETGHENFADASHPVFGYGGCAILARDYQSQLVDPWRQLKARMFGDASRPFHAKDVGMGERRIAEIANFFERKFHRFAAVTKPTTSNGSSLSNYELTAGAMLGRVREFAATQPSTRIAFIFESSQRLDPIADRFFPMVQLSFTEDGQTMPLPVDWYRMTKAPGEAGLEVADYVTYVAGRRVRQRERKDVGVKLGRQFDAIFRKVDRSMAGFMEVNAATQSQKIDPLSR